MQPPVYGFRFTTIGPVVVDGVRLECAPPGSDRRQPPRSSNTLRRHGIDAQTCGSRCRPSRLVSAHPLHDLCRTSEVSRERPAPDSPDANPTLASRSPTAATRQIATRRSDDIAPRKQLSNSHTAPIGLGLPVATRSDVTGVVTLTGRSRSSHQLQGRRHHPPTQLRRPPRRPGSSEPTALPGMSQWIDRSRPKTCRRAGGSTRAC